MTRSNEEPTIFVVDDDPALLRGLDIALQGRGYAVRTAPGGAEFLELLESESPDLVVMDVMMPGMSGLEVLRRLRADERWAELPVMMVTAYPHADVSEEAARRGVGDVVPKPFRLEELVERIEKQLGRRG
ncbi:MAG: response regulator, partial [Gemmatimonadota bacterium]